MGGRGSGSGLFADPDQVTDLKATAKELGYKTLRYTDSTGRQRDIRVDPQGQGVMTAAHNAEVEKYVQLAAYSGTDRLERDLADKVASEARQSATARALANQNATKAKAAGTRAAKLDAEIKALEMALRIARRKGHPANVW